MNIKSNEQGLHEIKRHFVNICEMVVSSEDEIIETPPLGSCVAVIFYDPQKRIGGIAHCLLSKSPDSWTYEDSLAGKYIDQAINILLKRMSELGAQKNDVIAKLVGGASVINFEDEEDVINIGDRNVDQAIRQLRSLGIPIHGQEVGGKSGRMVEFFINNGEVHVTGIKIKKKVI